MKDLKSDISIRQSMPVAARTATATGTSIDRQGFESVTFAIHVEGWTDGTHTFSAEHSDDGSTWSAVAAADLIGTMPVVADDESPSASSYENTTIPIGYIGNKRYARPVATITGVPSSGAMFGVDVILSHAHDRPVS